MAKAPCLANSALQNRTDTLPCVPVLGRVDAKGKFTLVYISIDVVFIRFGGDWRCICTGAA